MSALQTIDNMQFAKRGERLSGVFQAVDLPRLEGQLSRVVPEVQYLLQGVVRSGRPVIEVQVKATVVLVCQRCLGAYEQPLDIRQDYPVARNDGELALWEKDEPLLEALVADAKMVVSEFVEDEILLSLPNVPRHPDGECEMDVRLN